MPARRAALRVMTLAALVVAAVLCTVVVREPMAAAEGKPPSGGQTSTEGPPTARIRMEALGTQRDGITGRPRTGSNYVESVGETVTRFLSAGDQRDPSLCNARLAEGPSGDEVLLWRFDTKLLEVGGARSTIQVHWTRSRVANTVPERDETRTVTLAPGDVHVLDFVEDQLDGRPSCASLMVRIAADPIVPQSARSLTVDVWTVDENAAGGLVSVHQRVSGVSGESIGYQLPPLDVPAAGGRAMKLQVGGTLEAGIAPDGLVDITLTAVRKTVSGKATIYGEGRVQFRAKFGETAALLLPEPAGRLALPEGGGSIDVGRLFAGHRLSLYVKVEATR